MTFTETQAAPQPAVPHPRVRYVGIDLARFAAIAGMMAAHLLAVMGMLPGVSDPDRVLGDAVNLVSNGAPAALFAVLGGVSIVFATRTQIRLNRSGKAAASVAVRGAVLIVLGLLLGMIDNAIVVILAYYGLAMILVAPIVAVRSWILASIATVLGLFSGWVNSGVRRALETTVEGPHINLDFLAQDPLVGLRTLLLTGEYPVVTWTTYLLVGMLVGRALTSATARGTLGRASARLAALGATLFVIAQLISNLVMANLSALGIITAESSQAEAQAQLTAFGGSGAPPSPHLFSQFLAIAHSGSIMDLLRTFGISFFVIGALVFLFDRERTSRAAVDPSNPGTLPGPGIGARILDVVRATGAAPLTIYALHIVVSGICQHPYFGQQAQLTSASDIPWWVLGPGAFALQIAGALAIGAVLSATKRRGPLEAALSRIVGFVVR